MAEAGPAVSGFENTFRSTVLTDANVSWAVSAFNVQFTIPLCSNKLQCESLGIQQKSDFHL